MILVLLAVDFVRRALPLEAGRWPDTTPLRFAPHAGALALVLVCGAWARASTTTIPGWIRWNYEGIERKPSYPLLQALSKTLEGSIGDPRIAYENSPEHDRFGSMRVFENMALFTGRATLEGVLLQTAVTSPYVYWLQSQISKLGTGVIPGYSYPEFDPGRAVPRLALFNVRDLIAITPELKQALDRDARWERIFEQQPYAVYRLRAADDHYVRVPRFAPVLLDSEEWKRGFHRWFATDAALDVPLVAAHDVSRQDRSLFAETAASPTAPPRVPLDDRCEIVERIDHLEIEFTTTCPGRPHWISISHFPNWRAEGAKGPFLASPGFMLVIPEGPEVRLAFRRLAIDWIGIGLTAFGLGVCIAARRARAWQEPSGSWARVLEALHPWLLGPGIVVVLLFTAWHATRSWGTDQLYVRGWAAFEKGAYADAVREFERVRWLGPSSRHAADATFFRAASLLRMNDPAAALEGYEQVIAEHPDSIWVAESHFHVGLCLLQLQRPDEAARRFQSVVDAYPRNRWAELAAGQLEKLRPAASDGGGAAPE
jgi:hypothetical protein